MTDLLRRADQRAQAHAAAEQQRADQRAQAQAAALAAITGVVGDVREHYN